jgi:pyruvate kinase
VEVLQEMIEAGLCVARFNMCHGDHETHASLMKNVRTASKKAGRPVALFFDLAGPKIRIGDFSTPTVVLEEGKPFTITTEKIVGDVSRVSVNYEKLPKEVSAGNIIFLSDGKLALKVKEVDGNDIHTEIVHGGEICGRRGLNVPDAELSIPCLTAKDKKDLAFGLEQGVDFVCLSFVRSADDVHKLRALIGKKSSVLVAVKIETKQAIENIDEIMEATDAVMVARGDLAIEVPMEQVPLLQKMIIQKANKAGKPVITATQMLDSMRTNPVPTRAEVTDIANAILDGTDAVMLSEESAMGLFPARAIATMVRIAREVEKSALFAERKAERHLPSSSVCDAVTGAIVKTAHDVKAKAIVAFSESGYTGRMVARHRPDARILVLTPEVATFNQSILSYGCEPVLVRPIKQVRDAVKLSREALLHRGLAEKGDVFVMGGGFPFGEPGATNMLLVETV